MIEPQPTLTCTPDEVQALIKLHLTAIWENPASAAVLPPLMLWGPPGVGKSASVAQVAQRHGIGLLDLRLSQREPVDLRGLPVPRQDSVDWLLSSEWPRDPASRGIILFDELTAADRSLQVAAYELILDRRLGNLYAVPPGWYIVAAGNRATDGAVSLPMSSALANRFCHVEVTADAGGWLAWAVERGLHPDVVGFIRYRPALLFGLGEAGERGWPSPRSWERVSAELGLIERSPLAGNVRARFCELVVAGLVGPAAATEFAAYREIASSLPDALAMLEGRGPIVVPSRSDQRFALCSALVHHMRARADWPELLDRFLAIGLELPSDFASHTLVDFLQGRSTAAIVQVLQHPRMTDWSARHGAALAEGLGPLAADLASTLDLAA